MNIWKRKRVKSGLPTSEISKLLNIPEKKYIEIEENKREMPSKYIDAFMDIMHKSKTKEGKGELVFYMIKINEWFRTTDFKQLRQDWGYNTQAELATAMGFSNWITSQLEKGRVDFGNSTKITIYNFFQNELNKNIIEPLAEQEFEFDYALLKRVSGKSGTQIASEIGVSDACWSHWANGRYTPNKKSREKLVALLDKYTSTTVIEEDEEIIPDDIDMVGEDRYLDDVEPVIIEEDEYEEVEVNEDIKEVEIKEEDSVEFKLRGTIERHIKTIKKLERTIRCYEKLIENIKFNG